MHLSQLRVAQKGHRLCCGSLSFFSSSPIPVLRRFNRSSPCWRCQRSSSEPGGEPRNRRRADVLASPNVGKGLALLAALDRLALPVIGRFERPAHFLPALLGPAPALDGRVRIASRPASGMASRADQRRRARLLGWRAGSSRDEDPAGDHVALAGRLHLENLVTRWQCDPGLLAAGPDMPCRPQPRGIVERARTHPDHAIPWQAANPGAALRAH